MRTFRARHIQCDRSNSSEGASICIYEDTQDYIMYVGLRERVLVGTLHFDGVDYLRSGEQTGCLSAT